MLKIKVFWHNLKQCLDYWKEAIKQGALFRIKDIENSFYANGFYHRTMFFNNQGHFDKFINNHNIKD